MSPSFPPLHSPSFRGRSPILSSFDVTLRSSFLLSFNPCVFPLFFFPQRQPSPPLPNTGVCISLCCSFIGPFPRPVSVGRTCEFRFAPRGRQRTRRVSLDAFFLITRFKLRSPVSPLFHPSHVSSSCFSSVRVF